MSSATSSLVLACRYISASALTVLLWDHFITIGQEVRTIWNTPRTGIPKYLLVAGFFVNRYLVELGLIYGAYVLSGITTSPLHSIQCRAFLWILGVCGTLVIAVSHFVLVLKIYNSWDRRRVVFYVMIAGQVTVFVIFVPLLALAVFRAEDGLHVVVNICVIKNIPVFFPIGIAMLVAFDGFIIAFTIYNALEEPHSSNVEVIRALQTDGFRTLIGLFVLRVATVIVTSIGNPLYCLIMIMTVVALSTAVTSRLHMRLEDIKFYETPGLESIEMDGITVMTRKNVDFL